MSDLLRIKRFISATRWAMQGLRAAFVNEVAFRQELLACAVLVPVSFYLHVTAVEHILLVSALLWVLIVEVLNSGLEAVVDRISAEHHALSGRAKDLGAAAVLLSILNAVVVWGLVLIIG